MPLQAHHKAADYTLAKARLNMLHLVLEAGLLLAFTLGGGLRGLDHLLSPGLPPLFAGTTLLLGVFLIGALLELPLGIYQQFGIETRFGFNLAGCVIYPHRNEYSSIYGFQTEHHHR